MELILASKSPRRREILSRLGMVFRTEASLVNEDNLLELNNDKSVEERVKILSCSKVDYVASKYQNQEVMVLGADTVVVMKEQLFGKPQTDAHARKMISMLSGTTHQVITAVTVSVPSLCDKETALARTDVTFRSLTAPEIDWYVNHASYTDKAGGYGIQDEGALLVESISGCYYNVVGLPISLTLKLLGRFNHSFLDFQHRPSIKL